MKISFFIIEPWQEKILREDFKEHEIQIFSKALNSKNLEKISNAEIIVSRAKFLDLKFDKNTLEKLPNLKFIATMSTGFDHIDLEYCRQKNIPVSNVPSYGETSVAEQTFALILTISKKISQSLDAVKKDLIKQKNLTGFDLSKKTIGVIGSGKIGLNVIKIAKSFGMEILVYDIFKNNQASEELGFKYVELDELLQNSDIITLHTFLNKDSFHLLNKNNFPLLKKNAVIINTARGELIDTPALINHLKNNPHSFAGLDVVEGENNPQNENLKKLLELDNIIITPHNASNTFEARQKILNITIENIKGFIDGKSRNLIN